MNRHTRCSTASISCPPFLSGLSWRRCRPSQKSQRSRRMRWSAWPCLTSSNHFMTWMWSRERRLCSNVEWLGCHIPPSYGSTMAKGLRAPMTERWPSVSALKCKSISNMYWLLYRTAQVQMLRNVRFYRTSFQPSRLPPQFETSTAWSSALCATLTVASTRASSRTKWARPPATLTSTLQVISPSMLGLHLKNINPEQKIDMCISASLCTLYSCIHLFLVREVNTSKSDTKNFAYMKF